MTIILLRISPPHNLNDHYIITYLCVVVNVLRA